MKTPLIRPAKMEDIPHLKKIADATELFPPDLLEPMIEGYLSGSKPDLWTVYQKEEVPVSFAFCEPERMTEGTWNLLAIGVLPHLQGAGIGSQMIGDLEEALSLRAARILLVETMGTSEFELTRRFYQKLGFTEEARIREFYQEGADKVIFWKKLSGRFTSPTTVQVEHR